MVNTRKYQNTFIFFYGILLLTYALFIISKQAIPTIYSQDYKQTFDWIIYFFSLTCITYYILPINLIIVYGLFRRRAWVRYGVITVMLTIPIAILTKYLWWGGKSLNIQTIAIQIAVASLTIFLFTRQSIISFFGEKQEFKLKSNTGTFVKVIVLLAFVPLLATFMGKIFLYWKYEIPFFIDKPEIVFIEKNKHPELLKRFNKEELLNMSLLIPKDFQIIESNKSENAKNELSATLSDSSSNNIYLYNYATFSSLYDMFHGMGHVPKYLKSGFEFEKHTVTNNWNPTVLVINFFHSSGWDTIKEFYINDKKGFLKLFNDSETNRIIAEFSLYSSDNIHTISGRFEMNKDNYNEDDIMNIISSVEFL